MLNRTSATATIGTMTMIMKKRRRRPRKLMPSLCVPKYAARFAGGDRLASRTYVEDRTEERLQLGPGAAATMGGQTRGAIAQLGERLDRTQDARRRPRLRGNHARGGTRALRGQRGHRAGTARPRPAAARARPLRRRGLVIRHPPPRARAKALALRRGLRPARAWGSVRELR